MPSPFFKKMAYMEHIFSFISHFNPFSAVGGGGSHHWSHVLVHTTHPKHCTLFAITSHCSNHHRYHAPRACCHIPSIPWDHKLHLQEWRWLGWVLLQHHSPLDHKENGTPIIAMSKGLVPLKCQSKQQYCPWATPSGKPSSLRFLPHPTRQHLEDVQEGQSFFLDCWRGLGQAFDDRTTLDLTHYCLLCRFWWHCQKNLCGKFATEVISPEARCFYGFQIAIKNIHSETYSLLINKSVKDPTEKCTSYERSKLCHVTSQKHNGRSDGVTPPYLALPNAWLHLLL